MVGLIFASPSEIATVSPIAITPGMFDAGVVRQAVTTDFGIMACEALNRYTREIVLNGETVALVELGESDEDS